MKLLERAIGMLAPLVCQRCGQEGAVICSSCAVSVRMVPSRCYRCHRATAEFRTCPACRRKTPLKRVVPLVIYEGVVTESVHALKYARLQQAASEMVHLFPCPVTFDSLAVYVPVPTTSQRVRIRGYDQAVLLSRAFSQKTHAECKVLLRRVGKTHQVGASGKLRREQLQGAFTVQGRTTRLPKHVVLVDDVLTTGSTLEEAAKTLHTAGVAAIEAVVVAQA